MNIDELRAEAEAAARKSAEMREKDREQREKNDAEQQAFLSEMRPHLRQGKSSDYAAWLSIYLRDGSKPTHYYGYPMPTNNLYVAVSPFPIRPLYGSRAVSIIVPDGALCTDMRDRGHNIVYFGDGSLAGDFAALGSKSTKR